MNILNNYFIKHQKMESEYKNTNYNRRIFNLIENDDEKRKNNESKIDFQIKSTKINDESIKLKEGKEIKINYKSKVGEVKDDCFFSAFLKLNYLLFDKSGNFKMKEKPKATRNIGKEKDILNDSQIRNKKSNFGINDFMFENYFIMISFIYIMINIFSKYKTYNNSYHLKFQIIIFIFINYFGNNSSKNKKYFINYTINIARNDRKYITKEKYINIKIEDYSKENDLNNILIHRTNCITKKLPIKEDKYKLNALEINFNEIQELNQLNKLFNSHYKKLYYELLIMNKLFICFLIYFTKDKNKGSISFFKEDTKDKTLIFPSLFIIKKNIIKNVFSFFAFLKNKFKEKKKLEEKKNIFYPIETIRRVSSNNSIHCSDFINNSTSALYIKNKNMIKNIEKFKVNQTKNRKYFIRERKISNKIHFINIIMKFIIVINLFVQTKNNIFNSQLSQSSKITLKINGIGESAILGNLTNKNFEGIDYLDEVYINGDKASNIDYTYTFTQTNNFVELIWKDNLDNCKNMFRGCINITEINFTYFDTSLVNNMGYMFEGCSSLTFINLTNFNTSKVTSMYSMFNGCKSLTSINVSSFNTLKVGDIDGIFRDCSSLTFIDITNFNTSSATDMRNMFNGCSSLTSIDLSNFNTSQVTSMLDAFHGCLKLISLNLSSFETSLVTDMEYLFSDCINLEYINLKNFNESSLDNSPSYYQKMFYNLPENLVVCINQNLTERKIFPQITEKKCYTIDCSDDWKSRRYKIIANTRTCIDSCNNSTEYKYEYDGKCYANCSYYYYVVNESNYYCTNNLSCPEEYPNLIETKKKCIKYDFLNSIQDMLKIERNESEKMSKEEEIKCYDNILKNVEEGFTSENYDTKNLDKGEDEVIKTEKMTITFTTSQNQRNNINNNMSTIDLGECETLLRNYYNMSNNETLYMKKIDIVQEGMKATKVEYDVYSKLNGNNLVKLNLTVCGSTKISISIPLIITESLDKLNTSSGYYNDICYTTTTEDGTDISLKDRQNEFSETDKVVCQDDCDFSDYDYETSKAICSCEVKETPASIADMNINKGKLLENFKDIKNIVNFEFLICYKQLFKKEGIIKNIGCYILLVIILFHLISILIFYINQFPSLKKRIQEIINGIYSNNSGKQNKNQIIRINKIKQNIKGNNINQNIRLNKNNKNIKGNNINQNIKVNKNSQNIKANKNLNEKANSKIEIKKINNIKIKKVNNIEIKKVNNIKIKSVNKIGIKNAQKLAGKNEISIFKKGQLKNNAKKQFPIKKPSFFFGKNKIYPKINTKVFQRIKKAKNENKYIDEEINGLSYNLALQYDKRSYFEYYISLLRTKHSLIFALCNSIDYNSDIVKFDLFLVGFTIEYTVNALFYNDDTMHKIYESKGQFDLISQLPIIVYSYIISTVLNAPLNYLALSNDPILNFKEIKTKNNITKRAKSLKRILTIKFSFYFINEYWTIITCSFFHLFNTRGI